MPRTADSRVMISSSLSRASPRGDSTTVPSSTLAARSRSDAILFRDSPTARICSSVSASSGSGCTFPPTTAISRPWMAAAARPASCW
jgi:hypothetical protein